MQPDGSIGVSERLEVAFSGDFHYGYRDIPLRPGEAFARPSVVERGVAYRQGPEGTEVVLVGRHEPERWVLPKGTPNQGESLDQAGQVIRVPVAHAEGNYFADEDTLKRIEDRGQVAFRYCDAAGDVAAGNPNGSIRNIAGVFNDTKTVLGMMPHPENATEPLFGGTDGKPLFEALAAALV